MFRQNLVGKTSEDVLWEMYKSRIPIPARKFHYCHITVEKKIIILLIKVDLFWKNITRPRHLGSGEWAVTSRFLNAKNMLEERKCLSHSSFF